VNKKGLQEQAALFAEALLQMAEENSNLRRRLEDAEREVLTDHLTGLGNSRHLYIDGARIFDKCAKSGKFFSIFFIDLDYLKSINDRFSHAVGDAALKRLANELIVLFGGSTLLVRKSGDEFIVAMPCPSRREFEATRTSLAARMTKMRMTWKEGVSEKNIYISATSGGIVRRANKTSFAAMLDEADKILLTNKKRRRGDKKQKS
jgi:two-component system cell cycle response regulator